MENELIIAAIVVIVSIIGILILIRPHPVKVVRRDMTKTRNGNNWGEGWETDWRKGWENQPTNSNQ